MKKSKKLLSLILAVLMLISTLGETAFALSNNLEANSQTQGTEIEGKVEGNKEVFTFDFNKIKKEETSKLKSKTFADIFKYARSTQDNSNQGDTTVNVVTKGLNNKPFDWKALPNSQFKIVAKWTTKDGQKHEKTLDPAITAEGTFNVNVGWPVDGTLDGTATIETDFNQKIEARVSDVSVTSNFDGKAGLTFTLTLKELAEPRADVKYVDPYGRPLEAKDLPAAGDTMPKVTADELDQEISVDLPRESGKINMRSHLDIDEDELHVAENGLTFKVEDKTTGGKVKIGQKEYKLDISAPNAKEVGTIKMVYQKDVLVPPTKDDGSGDPVAPAEGYVRLTFDANEKVETGKTGITGKHTESSYAGKQLSYIDVKEGVKYDNANLQVAIKELKTTGTKVVNGETKTYEQDVKKPWTPEVPKNKTQVTKATYNAQYTKSAAEQVQELGGLKGKDLAAFVGDKLDANFWKKGAEAATTDADKKAKVDTLLAAATVTDKSNRSTASEVLNPEDGKLEVKFADESTLEVTQKLYVYKNGSDKPTDPTKPTPKDAVDVTYKSGEGVDKFADKTVMVKKGTSENDLPGKPEAKVAKGFKGDVIWIAAPKIDNTNGIQGTTTVTATAEKKTAKEQITEAGGLKAVDITAYKGDKIEGKFWNKGVALNKANEELQKLLEEATVTDESKRTTAAAGTFEGTLLVKFKDGSSIEVPNQKLIVKDTSVNISFDKDANDDANAPRHKDEVVKGKITPAEGVKVDGAIVEVKDEKGNSLGRGLANDDGTFNVGTKRPLKAGEDLSITVTLPEVGRPSDPVTKKVQLNPDELNNILPTADKIAENFKGKPGVSKDKVDKLQEAIKAGKALIDAKTKKPAASVPVTGEGQKSLDTAFENIKKAIEALTENQIPMINAPDHKEIFVNGEIDLDKDVKVVDDNIKKVDGKDYTYKIYDASGSEVQKTAMVAKDGVYRVVYSAEDQQGVKASHTMTVVVKKTVVEVPGEFPTPTPEGYVKVEFKSGEHAGLNGVSKFLVKKGSPKSEVTEPKIVPMEGYKVAEPKWSKEIPATFANDFETEAQVLKKVTTTEPDAKDKDKYATLTFEKGDHGEFEANAQTTIYVLKNEEVQFNAPKVNANDGFTFAKWDPELKTTYTQDTKHVAQYASNSDISDTEVKGFQEVKFVSGTDGNFGMTEAKENEEAQPIKTKSFWVRPGKLVDLRTKAPKVTVTTTGKSFVGWDQDLVQTFTKAQDPTVINAKYDDTVKTTKPTENVDKYAKVDFSAGNLGTIAADATKTYWVVKDAKVTLTPPTVTAKKGWKVKTGNDAWSPAVAESYTKDTIHVAQYDYNGESVVPQKPGEDKPAVPENFVKVEFKKGDHGVISSDETFVYWVDPTKAVNLTAPAVIANTNYKHSGWKNGDAVVDLTKANNFEKATDIVAQYKSTVVTEDPHDENYVTVEFNAKDHGTLEGTAKFWVYKNEKVSITAPKVTAKAGYTFDKWNPAVKDSYAEATVHNATYTTNNDVSDTEVQGYNKVTFKPGDHGTLTEKSVWVKPDTVVDLNDKAPKVTSEKGYSHIGWKPGLVGKFENNTDIVAQYTEEKTPEPTVTARNIGTEGPDGNRVPATKTTVEIETVPKAKVTIEYTDKEGHPQKLENLTAGEDGKLKQEITPKLKEGTPVKVTVQDGEKQPADKTVKVFEDLDGDKIPDTQAGQTERPAAIASNKGKDKGAAPTFTTIEGKTEKGAVITVTVKVKGEEKPVTVENLEVKDDGTYTLEAKYNNKPLENGAEILVYAQNAPKTISEPQTTTVFNDTNNDGKPDGGKVDLTKIQDIQVIDPNKMTYVEGTDGSLDLTGLKVVVRDTDEEIQIFEYDTTTNKFKDGDTVVDGFTVKVNNNEVAQGTTLTSVDHNNKKITVAYGQKSGETVQALKVTKTLPAPVVDDVKKGDKTVNVTVPTNGETKIIVKVGDKEVVAEKDSNGQWKVGDKPVNTVDGKLQIPVEELKQGDVVKVTTEDPAGNKGETEKKVPVDEDSAKPTDVKAKNEPATPNKTTITGKATKGAVITITDKDGNVLTTDPSQVKVDDQGNFTATIDKKDPNTLLLVSAKEDGKEPSASVPAQVEGSSDVVEKKPGVDKPNGFVEVTFAIKDADQAKGTLEGAKAYYVNPKVPVSLNPPTFKANTGYKLTGWDTEGKLTIDAKKYTTDTTIYAVIGEVDDIVDASGNTEKPAGYVEVRFALDTSKAKFDENAVTKYYVNPTKEIKLTAPGVIVTDKAYTFEGWDNNNWNGTEFNKAKYETDTLITAKLKGSFVEKPQVGDVTTGDTTVNVNPGSADKVKVEVEGQGTVVVEKDKNGIWTTPDGTVVTPDGSGNLPIPVQPIGEKALVEVTVEKGGVVSEKVAKTAQKRIGLSVSNMEENIKGIVVQTYPAGVKVTISLNGEVLIEDYTSSLGILTAILKNPKKAGENYTIKAEMDGYKSEELTLPVIVK